MASQELNLAIVRYLEKLKQNKETDDEAKETLEAAIQCLHEVFGIDPVLHDQMESDTVGCELDLFDLYAEYQRNRSDKNVEDRKKQSESLKAQGNIELKNGNLQSALNLYTKAIEIDDTNAVFFCNRALVHIKLGDHSSAQRDCQRAIDLNPNYSRAYGRQGHIFMIQRKWQDAKASYSKALEIDSTNEEYQANLQDIEKRIEEASKTSNPDEGTSRGLNLGGIFQNPQFMQMASSMMSNPMFQSMASSLMNQMRQPQTEGEPRDDSNFMSHMQSMAQQFSSMPNENPPFTPEADSKEQSDQDNNHK